MSTKMKWVIALFALQLLAWVGIAIADGSILGAIGYGIGTSAFAIAGFIVWHYESLDKARKSKRSEISENQLSIDVNTRADSKKIDFQNLIAIIACGILSTSLIIAAIIIAVIDFQVISFSLCLVIGLIFGIVSVAVYFQQIGNESDEDEDNTDDID